MRKPWLIVGCGLALLLLPLGALSQPPRPASLKVAMSPIVSYEALFAAPNLKVIGYPMYDLRPGGILTAYATIQKWLAANRPVAEKFVRGINRGIDFVRNNPAETRRIIIKYARLNPEVASKIAFYQSKRGVGVADIQWLVDLMYAHGLLKQKPEPLRMVDSLAQ